ncbi:type II toxin-antitoxin system RelE/ParE family toxin, partial [Burkholderia pseudomallei]
RVVVLHSFEKNTQETPQNELRTARVRLSEVRKG